TRRRSVRPGRSLMRSRKLTGGVRSSARLRAELLFSQLGLCQGRYQLHICQNNMSGFLITQTNFQKVQV
ncbi:mCG23051, partial [Mus musculus]